jgi:hypothetical protein
MQKQQEMQKDRKRFLERLRSASGMVSYTEMALKRAREQVEMLIMHTIPQLEKQLPLYQKTLNSLRLHFKAEYADEKFDKKLKIEYLKAEIARLQKHLKSL